VTREAVPRGNVRRRFSSIERGHKMPILTWICKSSIRLGTSRGAQCCDYNHV
jgi:hypothetical protein